MMENISWDCHAWLDSSSKHFRMIRSHLVFSEIAKGLYMDYIITSVGTRFYSGRRRLPPFELLHVTSDFLSNCLQDQRGIIPIEILYLYSPSVPHVSYIMLLTRCKLLLHLYKSLTYALCRMFSTQTLSRKLIQMRHSDGSLLRYCAKILVCLLKYVYRIYISTLILMNPII